MADHITMREAAQPSAAAHAADSKQAAVSARPWLRPRQRVIIGTPSTKKQTAASA
ncbi:hypothetical protein GCM10027320_17450 [Massilia solisilvae]